MSFWVMNFTIIIFSWTDWEHGDSLLFIRNKCMCRCITLFISCVLHTVFEWSKTILPFLQEWWTYVCMGPSDPHPNWHLGMRGTQHRAVMWRVWKEGGTGFLYWGANCYERATLPSAEVIAWSLGPLLNCNFRCYLLCHFSRFICSCKQVCFRRGLPPGDGVLFYPGEVYSTSHEPVASVRLERILSGLQVIF